MIKKTILLCLAVLSLITAQGQQASNINGTFDGVPHRKVTLFKVYNGRLIDIATSTPDALGRFAFRFIPEYEGLYAVGTGTALNQQDLNRFYFKGGDEVNYKIIKEGYDLLGDNSKENQALYNWDIQSRTFKTKGTMLGGMSTYVDFFPEVEAFKENLSSIGQSVKTGNTKFDKLFPLLVDYDFAYYALSFLNMPRTAHPSKEEMSEYYTTFDSDKYLTAQLLDLPYGDRFMSNLVFRKFEVSKTPNFDEQVSAIPLDVLKGQYVLGRMEKSRAYNEFQELYEKYKNYFTLEEQKQRAAAVEAMLVETKTGVPAFRFSFPDINGKEVSLNDLKGKVVLLDLWATWCGPCRTEEPHWEKLNEEYKDKPVAFVGVSVDQDKPKWEEYLKTKKLKGIQVHAGSSSELAKAYKANSIPRYILIDKAGNLISADSPRPSDPKLKGLLDEWLKK